MKIGWYATYKRTGASLFRKRLQACNEEAGKHSGTLPSQLRLHMAFFLVPFGPDPSCNFVFK